MLLLFLEHSYICKKIKAAEFALALQSPKLGLLVCSLKSWEELNNLEVQQCAASLSVPVEEVPSVVVSSLKFYTSQSGYGDVLYRSGEFILAKENDQEFIVKVHKFISVQIHDTYRLLCRGDIHCFIEDSNGKKETNFWAGYGHILLIPSEACVLIQTSSLIRQVLVYRAAQSNIVCDYLRRSTLHYRVVVPSFFELNDMVLIQGGQVDEIWHGQIVKIDENHKTVAVNFYVEDPTTQDVYVRESLCCTSQNNVSWKSIIGLADVQWQTNKTWKKH